jgi:hypothetical protein
MNVLPLDKYITKVIAMVDRKRIQVRNAPPDDFESSRQLDFYLSRLVSLRELQKRGEKYYIKF